MSPFFNFLRNLLLKIFFPGRNCVPVYEPQRWNDYNGVQYYNNCYNYATNIITGTFAQPGRASGFMFNVIACADIKEGANRDGLIDANCNRGCGCAACCHMVALTVIPNLSDIQLDPKLIAWLGGTGHLDYHWYRKDRDGTWSHKLGSGLATNRDHGGNIIRDPRYASRGPYIEFCGCFCVCQGQVTIN